MDDEPAICTCAYIIIAYVERNDEILHEFDCCLCKALPPLKQYKNAILIIRTSLIQYLNCYLRFNMHAHVSAMCMCT